MQTHLAKNRVPGRLVIITLAMCSTGWLLSGCKDTSQSVGQRIRQVDVRTVTDQGRTLGPDADPKEVVYVLVRALKDDIEAGDDAAGRSVAYDRQLAVCAPAHIHKYTVRRNLTQDENVYHVVWHWAPTLGHYVHNFDFDWPTARDEMLLEMIPANASQIGEERARVSLEMADPSGDTNASVVARFELVREQGYWRVYQLGFAKGIRHLAGSRDRSTAG